MPAARSEISTRAATSDLVECFDELLADPRWFAVEVNPEITATEMARIRAGRSALAQAAAELATGVPATIQHDDLHDGNLFLDADRARVIDWGDAVIAHPFSTLRVTLDVLAYVLRVSSDAVALARVRDAYLDLHDIEDNVVVRAVADGREFAGRPALAM
jgi:Ser/Thr protein kinase RdoA (MazF antagonist)